MRHAVVIVEILMNQQGEHHQMLNYISAVQYLEP